MKRFLLSVLTLLTLASSAVAQQERKGRIDGAQGDNNRGITALDGHCEKQQANTATEAAERRKEDACWGGGGREALPGVGAHDDYEAHAGREQGESCGWHATVGAELAEDTPESPGDSAGEGENDSKLLHVLAMFLLCLRGDQETAFDLALQTTPDARLSTRLEEMSLEDAERLLITKALARFEGNANRAAEALGLSRSALYRRLQKYGLS